MNAVIESRTWGQSIWLRDHLIQRLYFRSETEELEGSVEIVKCNSHHHLEAVALWGADVHKLTLQKRPQSSAIMYCSDLLIKDWSNLRQFSKNNITR